MSLPAAALAPDSGDMKPILVGPCADASRARTTTSDTASSSLTTRMSASSDRLASDGGAPAPRNPKVRSTGLYSAGRDPSSPGEAMEIDRPLPNPMTPEAKPYWDGLREGKLMLPKCGACGHVFWYPRVACPRCHTRNIGWIQSEARGTLHAFEIGYQSFNKAVKVPAPYVLAMVELAEAQRRLSHRINRAAD